MAAELVGGALLSAFLQVAFDRLASPQVLQFFRGRKLDEKLLSNLNTMLHSINVLADDAEQKQFRNPHIKAWLFAVKDVVFDAEDLLKEIEYELTRCQVLRASLEIRDVLEKLEYLAKQKGALGLKEGIYSGDGSDFCFRLKFDKGNIPNTTRHFSFSFGDVGYFDGLGSLTDAKRLRSFHSLTSGCFYEFNPCQFNILVHELFSKFKFLRVLSLKGYAELSEVPNSVGDLKNLCSIDLSYTHIQKLPDSICLLYNLLIMKMNFCSFLEELPSNFHKLTKLNCLEFKDTKVTKMPMHFGELKNLQVLSTFCIDRDSEVINIKQLGGLNLHGRLSINEVQNIVNPLDALEANLKNQLLVELELKWNENHIPNDPRKEKKVLENLQPPNHLEDLSIENYGGTEFPSWVFDNSLSNLVLLHLENCKYCLWLPPLGLLSSLKSLEITGLDGIVSIGAEFYGSDSSSFRSLETLKFYNMKEWEEWECKTTSFPRLQHLSIDKCRKLKGLPEHHLHLKELFIKSCDKVIISGNNMDTSSLQIKIRGDENLKLLPKCMQILLPSLGELRVIECPKVEMFPDGGLPSNIKDVSLSSFKLIATLRENLDANTCLESLCIENVDVESFPDDVLLPHSITVLRISDCPNLKKMDYKGLCHLSSLRLFDCPNLRCLPEEGLPKSMSSLSIWNCPLLEPRCRRNPKAQDLISHIEELRIGHSDEVEV
ncbi:disease resistance protein RPM1 [Vigna unguiculata]|uniref:Disease resistance protein RPM1 n=1 Tax=Vigna unguiculata TaxID=3917 RepID=A0A4D6M319_VIGUN|nr:disease resistance protein RPM1 [Vigna unguiculata]